MCLTASRQSLVNLFSAGLATYSANQGNQNQVKDIFGISFRLIVLFVFFLILTFVLQKVTLKHICSLPTFPCIQPTKFG